jgi:hypothetical protein
VVIMGQLASIASSASVAVVGFRTGSSSLVEGNQ